MVSAPFFWVSMFRSPIVIIFSYLFLAWFNEVINSEKNTFLWFLLLEYGGLYTKIITVCSCHVTYTFQSEFTPYSCLNVKELFARSRRKIWSLSDCNWTRTQNHLVLKRTLNHLAKLDSLWNAYVTWQEHTVKWTVQISTQNTAQKLYTTFSYRLSLQCKLFQKYFPLNQSTFLQ